MINYGQVTMCSNSQNFNRRAIVFTLTWKSIRYFVAISNSPQTWCQLSTDIPYASQDNTFCITQFSLWSVCCLPERLINSTLNPFCCIIFHLACCSPLKSLQSSLIVPLSGTKPVIAIKLISTFSQHLLSVLSCACSHSCRKPDAMTFFSRVLVGILLSNCGTPLPP